LTTLTALLNSDAEFKKLLEINLEVIKMLKGLSRAIQQKRKTEDIALSTIH